jgi:hypothetical protein
MSDLVVDIIVIVLGVVLVILLIALTIQVVRGHDPVDVIRPPPPLVPQSSTVEEA